MSFFDGAAGVFLFSGRREANHCRGSSNLTNPCQIHIRLCGTTGDGAKAQARQELCLHILRSGSTRLMIPISTLISPALWHRRKSRGQEMGVSCLSVPLYCGIKGNPHRKPQISGFPYFETRPNPNSRISALAGTEWCSSTCTTAWLLRQSPANSISDLDAMFCRQVPELVLRMRRGVSLFWGWVSREFQGNHPLRGDPSP